ncbi:MAG: hypothetical protein ABIK36_17580 [Pseudomonadota bacterium]
MTRFRHLSRHLVAAAIATAFVAMPCALHVTADGLSVEAAAAHAKKGGGGKGGGNGNGNSGKGNAGKSKAKAAKSPQAILRHRNGMKESVRGGRYEMRDAKGRRIVNRPATGADYRRLKVN